MKEKTTKFKFTPIKGIELPFEIGITQFNAMIKLGLIGHAKHVSKFFDKSPFKFPSIFFKTLVSSVIFLMLQFSYLGAQEIKTIDNTGAGDFQSFSEAIDYINNLPTIPVGGIIFQVVSGQEFVEVPDTITVLASSDNPIVFTSDFIGTNPIIKSDTAYQVIHFRNSSHITFSGIDIGDANVSDTIHFQMAYYVFASNNITITQCNMSNFSNYGVYVRDASQNIVIDKNTVFHSSNFINLNSSVYGIYVNYNASTDSIVVSNNRLFGLNAQTTVYGIYLNQINSIAYNNFISLTADNDKVYGLRVTGRAPNAVQCYYNSVLIDGNATDNGYAFYGAGGDGVVKAYNNIFINLRDTTDASNNEQQAINISFDGPDYFVDYNILYSATVLAEWKGAWKYDLSQWQAISMLDSNSLAMNVVFNSPDTGDLHLDAQHWGDFYFAAKPIEGIINDIDEETRESLFPYKGADENSLSLNLQLTSQPNSIDFGTVFIGDESAYVVHQLFSQVSFPILLDSIVAPDGFVFNVNDTTSDLSFLDNVILYPNDTLNLAIKFTPNVYQIFNDLLSIYVFNHQRLDVQLIGQSLPQFFSTNQNAFDFGLHRINTSSDSLVLRIYNLTDSILVFDSIISSDYFQIKIEDDPNWTTQIESFFVEPNDSIAVLMKYNALIPGVIEQTLGIYGYEVYYPIGLTGTCYAMKLTDLNLGLTPVWNGTSAFGDYDNDHDLDLLVTGYGLVPYESYAYLIQNNGDMDFEYINANFEGVGSGMADFVDIDNDNDLDVFLQGKHYQHEYISKIYTNTDGSFTEQNSGFRNMFSGSSDWGDYDGDGDFDAIITGEERLDDTTGLGQFTVIYENQGNLVFEEHLIDPYVDNSDAKWGDYDNDGDLDIAITGSAGSYTYISRILRNDGDNEFNPVQELYGLRYSAIEWGDYDQDGDLDVLLSGSFENESHSVAKIYRNDGGDVFTDIQTNILGVRQGDANWGDVDQDGDIDVIMNGIYYAVSGFPSIYIGYIYLNQGNGDFVLADSIESVKYADIQLGDLDGDNDLDLLLTGRYDYQDYRCAVYENQYNEIQNTTPQAPNGLGFEVNNSSVTFYWDASFDNETDTAGLTYNLRIGTSQQTDNVKAAMSDNSDGYRLVPAKGNVGQTLSFTVPSLPNGSYYASVQAIDNSFIGSSFSNEVVFDVDGIKEHVNSINPLVYISPNPFNKQFLVEINTQRNEMVSLSILNTNGQLVEQWVENMNLPAGKTRLTYNAVRLSANTLYYLKVNVGNQQQTYKLLKTE